ncbi:hypothetical protein ABTE09_20085, partial [Acinetobacter baumannii]
PRSWNTCSAASRMRARVSSASSLVERAMSTDSRANGHGAAPQARHWAAVLRMHITRNRQSFVKGFMCAMMVMKK